MILRVRTPSGGTLKLRVEPSLGFDAFLTQAAAEAGLPSAACSLSLNRKESLSPAPGTPLSQVGLAGGDLLYLLSSEPGSGGAATAAPPPAAAAPVAAPAAPPSGGHRNLPPQAAPRRAAFAPAPAVVPYANPLGEGGAPLGGAPAPAPHTAAAGGLPPSPPAAAAAAAAARAEREGAVRRLGEMGFPRGDALAALAAAGGDLSAAAASLAANASEAEAAALVGGRSRLMIC